MKTYRLTEADANAAWELATTAPETRPGSSQPLHRRIDMPTPIPPAYTMVAPILRDRLLPHQYTVAQMTAIALALEFARKHGEFEAHYGTYMVEQLDLAVDKIVND